MTPAVVIALAAAAASETLAATPPPTYTVADVIGRNPDDVCLFAYRSGHWSEWLKADGAQHHAGRFQRAAMEHYCDGFIHGIKYKGR